jgi:hypothetical protein
MIYDDYCSSLSVIVEIEQASFMSCRDIEAQLRDCIVQMHGSVRSHLFADITHDERVAY